MRISSLYTDGCCRFLVELEEVDSMTGLNQERTGEQVFRTAATPSGRAGLADKSQYSLLYHWDGLKTDLSTVDIVFSKSLLNNPNCLDFIKVTGSEARVTTGQSSRTINSFHQLLSVSQ